MPNGQVIQANVATDAATRQSTIGHLREGQEQVSRIEASLGALELFLVAAGLSDSTAERETKDSVDTPRATDLASVSRDINTRVRIAANRLSDISEKITAELQ